MIGPERTIVNRSGSELIQPPAAGNSGSGGDSDSDSDSDSDQHPATERAGFSRSPGRAGASAAQVNFLRSSGRAVLDIVPQAPPRPNRLPNNV